MRRNKKNILKNRLLNFSTIILFTIILLIGRLFWFQIIKSDEYRMAALKQRGKEVKLYPERGVIYDKNLIPLTNRERLPTVYFTDYNSYKDYVNDNKIYIKENENSDNEILSCI